MSGFQRNQIEIEKTGITCQVPNTVRAHLMYYLKCVNNVLDLSEISNINYFTDYQNYHRLDQEDMKKLLFLCYMFDPDTLDQVFHQVDDCGDASNEFYQITNNQLNMVAGSGIVIGGVRRKVLKMMVYKRSWIIKNYHTPMRELAEYLS